MDLRLAGKRALVTGSSSGIGEAIARMLAAEGCQVVVHGRDADRTRAVAQSIGAQCWVLGDLAVEASADAVAHAAGDIDILVNNAGGSAPGTTTQFWTEVADGDWGATYAMNVLAAARLVRRLLPFMQNNAWGRIVNIASTSGSSPMALGPDYGAAKAAMLNMTVSLSKAVAGSGVTVNSISPGPILTPSVQQWGEKLAAQYGWDHSSFDAIERRMVEAFVPVPVGRLGRPDHIGHIVCMIASPAADFMTGTDIRVDGGQMHHAN